MPKEPTVSQHVRARRGLARQERFHMRALELIDALSVARAAAGQDVRKTGSLKALVRAWRRSTRTLGDLRDGLRVFGYDIGHRIKIGDVEEPGWHLALLALVESRLIDPEDLLENLNSIPDRLPNSCEVPESIETQLSTSEIALCANTLLADDFLNEEFRGQEAALRFELGAEYQVMVRCLWSTVQKTRPPATEPLAATSDTVLELHAAGGVICVNGAPHKTRSKSLFRFLETLGQLQGDARMSRKAVEAVIEHSNIYTFIEETRVRQPALWAFIDDDGTSLRLRPGVRVQSK
jgi:hypothetical protein